MRGTLPLIAIQLFFGLCATINANPNNTLSQNPETLLNIVLEEIRQGQTNKALAQIELLLRKNPNFRLAHLIKGDLLLAHSRPITDLGNISSAPKERLEDLRAEAIARLRAYRERPPVNEIPRYLIQFENNQKYAILVEAQKSRLYLYENKNGIPHYITDYYVTIGKQGIAKAKQGDQKTPIGVYYITDSLSKNKLTDFYGPGAFPLNYPNERDKKLGKNGHGIWIHGTPSDTYSRPPRASDGCVVLANQDFDSVSKFIQVGITPVIISDNIEWIAPHDWNKQKQGLNEAIENWRKDWETLNTDRYLRHYSKNFWTTDSQSITKWSDQKRLINTNKTWLKIQLTNVSIFRNPGKDDFFVVTFEQDYRSNNLLNKMKKRQYWTLEEGEWKILYEGAV